MIKNLIRDLAHDSISLSQALTRTKLIQSKLKVEELKIWLTNELNGYSNKEEVPEYRNLKVNVVGHFIDDFGREWKNAPLMLEDLGRSLDIDFYDHTVSASIKTIEDAIMQTGKEEVIMIPFGQSFVNRLADLYRKNDSRTHLISAGSIVIPSQYRHILEQTKQRLLDTLLDLQDKFNNIDDDFIATNESKAQARNIINYHIYGGSNNSNIAVGENVAQNGNQQDIGANIQGSLDQLRRALVPNDEIEKIQTIVNSNESQQTKFSKAMKWIGELSKNMIAKGIEIKLPEIIEATEKMINRL